MPVSLSLPVLIITMSGFAGLAAIWLGWNAIGRWALLSSRTQRRIHDAETPNQHRESATHLPSNTLERKLVEANIGLSVLQFRLASLGLGLAAALISWFFFIPGLPALMIGGILGYPIHSPQIWGLTI